MDAQRCYQGGTGQPLTKLANYRVNWPTTLALDRFDQRLAISPAFLKGR